MEKKYNHTDPETIKKFDKNAGRWADKEKARAASAKGAETKRKKAKMREAMLSLREDALQALIEKDPEIFEKLVATIATKAVEGDRDAMRLMVSMGGLEAPKKQETTLKKKEMSAEEAQSILDKALKKSK